MILDRKKKNKIHIQVYLFCTKHWKKKPGITFDQTSSLDGSFIDGNFAQLS